MLSLLRAICNIRRNLLGSIIFKYFATSSSLKNIPNRLNLSPLGLIIVAFIRYLLICKLQIDKY